MKFGHFPNVCTFIISLISYASAVRSTLNVSCGCSGPVAAAKFQCQTSAWILATALGCPPAAPCLLQTARSLHQGSTTPSWSCSCSSSSSCYKPASMNIWICHACQERGWVCPQSSARVSQNIWAGWGGVSAASHLSSRRAAGSGFIPDSLPGTGCSFSPELWADAFLTFSLQQGLGERVQCVPD